MNKKTGMLKSKDVYLAPLAEKDYQVLFKWINDRDTVILNSSYRPVSERQHRQWFDSISKRSDTYIFIVKTVKGRKTIGSCQLHSVDLLNSCAELQIRIGDDNQRGKGYGSQAVALLLKFAFTDLNLNRVYLNVFSFNKRAVNSYLKTGFKMEGTLRKAAFVDGKFVDVIHMGILKSEYKP